MPEGFLVGNVRTEEEVVREREKRGKKKKVVLKGDNR